MSDQETVAYVQPNTYHPTSRFHWVISSLLVVLGGLFGAPSYMGWQSGKSLETQLAESKIRNQMILDEAHATAQANQIITEGITPEILQFRWVEGMKSGGNTVIYVPLQPDGSFSLPAPSPSN